MFRGIPSSYGIIQKTGVSNYNNLLQKVGDKIREAMSAVLWVPMKQTEESYAVLEN